MSEQKNTHGGKREGSGNKSIDTEKRVHTVRLTLTEKEIIEGYRQAKGLDKWVRRILTLWQKFYDKVILCVRQAIKG